jgi:pimeloyl-ACP methyl ester carboxylesterase
LLSFASSTVLYAIIKEDTVVTVLPEGHGQEILQRGQAMEQRMAAVRAVIDAAGCDQAAVCGSSEGGLMSVLFAATYPAVLRFVERRVDSSQAEDIAAGLWAFGFGRVPPRAHLALIWGVALTAYASTFWIMVVNGFMQRPVGYEMRDGTAYVTDWGAVLTNGATWYAIVHIAGAVTLLAGLFMTAVSAYHLLRGDDPHGIFRRGMRFAAVVMTVMPFVVVTFGGLQFQIFGQDPPTSGLTYTAEEIEAIESAARSTIVTTAGRRASHSSVAGGEDRSTTWSSDGSKPGGATRAAETRLAMTYTIEPTRVRAHTVRLLAPAWAASTRG